MLKQNVLILWIILAALRYNDDVFLLQEWNNFHSTSLLLELLRWLEIKTPRPSLLLELLHKALPWENEIESEWDASKLQMGCIPRPNSWGIYRVKTLELKGCLQCQHSILRQMCGELVSVARRTNFVQRTKKLSSPTFS